MEGYEYTSKFKTLIARERNAEIDFHTKEIKSTPPHIREKKGRTLTRMQTQPNPKLQQESIFRFVRSDTADLPNNELSIGSNVIISIKDPLNDGLKGVVQSKSTKFIDIYVLSQSNILRHKNLRIDLFVNDSTYEAQLKILNSFKDWPHDRRQLRDVILHKEKPKLNPKVSTGGLFDTTLNPSQKLAVEYSIKEENLYLIQGPPGTGKTKTSVEIIRQHLKQNKTVLVCADSNIAVDNIMMGLLKHINVIRIGESPKILKEIQEHTINNLIKKDMRFSLVEQGMARVKEYREKQRKFLVPNKKNARGISYFQIRKMAQARESGFGISYDNIFSMSQWIKYQDGIKRLNLKINKAKQDIIESLISSASVICTTNTNANHPYLDKTNFDLVLIDEAGQSTEPSCLIPISKAKKVILVGDHKQLPPTILNPEAEDLSVSLFERMFGKSRFTLLNTQYRMHPHINEFPSNEFYDGKLLSAEFNKEKKLEKSPFKNNIVFIESKGPEKIHKGATSFHNPKEGDLVMELIQKYGAMGYNSDDIGIISPYLEQVKRIKEMLPFVEVNSIDGFQGREKRIIIISLVRSNHKGNIGFLKDMRRLNVALTRAISELVVIGNPETISSNETYAKLLEYIKKSGEYIQEGKLE